MLATKFRVIETGTITHTRQILALSPGEGIFLPGSKHQNVRRYTDKNHDRETGVRVPAWNSCESGLFIRVFASVVVSALFLAYVRRGCANGIGLPLRITASRCWDCSAKP